MRTYTTEHTVYKFDELDESTKEAAIEKLWDINVDYQWWELTYEDAANIGLKITEFDLDRHRHVKGEFTLSADEVAANIIRDHGPDCDTYRTAETFLEEQAPILANYLNEEHEDFESWESEDKLRDLEDDFLHSLCEDYSIMLQHECEYLTSEEAIIETNDYEFDENGNLV